jgi:putative glutathione S-transferase
MGLLQNGQWVDKWYDTKSTEGRYVRKPSAFRSWATANDIGATRGDYYPEAEREEIDALNSRVYDTVNNGVYKAGLATAQTAYEDALDPVYVGHLKCNQRRIADYPNLSGYVRDLYQYPRVAATVDIAYIRKHYYGSHEKVNPTRVVPKGPIVDYAAPHNRTSLNKEKSA